MTYLSNNIVRYTSSGCDIAYIIVDRIDTYQSNWTKELIKNISDYTVSDVWSKGYDVLVGLDEDELLQYAANRYSYAVVISTGTEFINGSNFFDAVKELTTQDFFLAGHILDRKEAYYELHHQCYIINLSKYKELDMPEIGQQQLGDVHRQDVPLRSSINIHDDYTPIWVSGGDDSRDYRHKLHGWNILSRAFENDLPVVVFNNNFRDNKKYYYPENQQEFLKHISWAYARESYCANEHVHFKNTEYVRIEDKDFECVITPASGTWFLPYIAKDKPVKVIYYDYNQSSLNYWEQHAPVLENVTYEFIKIDLLGFCDYSQFSKSTTKTIINLSNIFCYEGTSMFSNLVYRNYKEGELLKNIPSEYYTFFNSRSCLAFYNAQHYGKNIQPVSIKKLLKPTWHSYDWV